VAFLFCLIAKHVVSEAPSNNFPACHFGKKRNESRCEHHSLMRVLAASLMKAVVGYRTGQYVAREHLLSVRTITQQA
jgi:hypothetical protein